ncbi:hypothetical protein STEG23_013024, partial [Scotinomys teguina]
VETVLSNSLKVTRMQFWKLDYFPNLNNLNMFSVVELELIECPERSSWESKVQQKYIIPVKTMMCEVMPTINEDTPMSQRGSQSSGSDSDSHFEQLMVNMLDERDRLLDTLRETQESLSLAQQRLQDVIYDRDSLQRQLNSALPQGQNLVENNTRAKKEMTETLENQHNWSMISVIKHHQDTVRLGKLL